MKKQRLKKPEAVNIQGICVICGVCKQVNRGGGNYRPTCQGCTRERRGLPRSGDTKLRQRPYLVHRKTFCEKCNFIAEHSCQLDVDHIGGDRFNNDISNLQTLCANCHRLKTYLNRDWDKGA